MKLLSVKMTYGWFSRFHLIQSILVRSELFNIRVSMLWLTKYRIDGISSGVASRMYGVLIILLPRCGSSPTLAVDRLCLSKVWPSTRTTCRRSEETLRANSHSSHKLSSEIHTPSIGKLIHGFDARRRRMIDKGSNCIDHLVLMDSRPSRLFTLLPRTT